MDLITYSMHCRINGGGKEMSERVITLNDTNIIFHERLTVVKICEQEWQAQLEKLHILHFL